MHKIYCSFICVLLIACFLPINCYSLSQKPTTSAKSYIVYEPIGDLVICEKDADRILPMASTTKIMTALVAIEQGGNLDRVIKVSPAAAGIEGSSIYLYSGENITLRSLLYALLLRSANDAAAAIAIDIGGSIEGFAQMMNQKASVLGLAHTHFENPHGLDSEYHYTTARELAKIAAAALENEEFAKIVATEKISIPMMDGSATRLITNHNKLLFTYDGAIGVKTGYTKTDGRCLVSAAKRDDMTIIVVTLSDPNDWADHTNLLNYAFENYRVDKLCTERENSVTLPVISGVKDTVLCVPDKEIILTSEKDTPPVTAIYEQERFLYAPVYKGEIVGHIYCIQNGIVIDEINLTATEDVDVIKYKFNLFRWIASLFED